MDDRASGTTKGLRDHTKLLTCAHITPHGNSASNVGPRSQLAGLHSGSSLAIQGSHALNCGHVCHSNVFSAASTCSDRRMSDCNRNSMASFKRFGQIGLLSMHQPNDPIQGALSKLTPPHENLSKTQRAT